MLGRSEENHITDKQILRELEEGYCGSHKGIGIPEEPLINGKCRFLLC